MISAKLACRISLGGAAVLLLLILYGAFQPDPAACGSLARSYPVVVAQELARSRGDLQAIFGGAPSVCRAALAHALDVVTLIDSVIFIPAYAAFLLFFVLATVPRDEHAALIGFVLSAVAVVADYVENVCLFQVTAPDAGALWLAVLPWATGVKWIGLGLAGAVGGMILIKSGRVNYPAALACGLGFLGTVLGIANPHLFGPHISDSVLLSWIVFLIVDIRGALLDGASTMPQLEVEDGAG